MNPRLKKDCWIIDRGIWGGGSPKIWVKCVGPPKTMFYCILRRNFGSVLFYGTKLFSKNRPKIRKICENFLKNQCFSLQNDLKWKDLKNFDEIAHKTTHRPFLQKKFKISKN